MSPETDTLQQAARRFSPEGCSWRCATIVRDVMDMQRQFVMVRAT